MRGQLEREREGERERERGGGGDQKDASACSAEGASRLARFAHNARLHAVQRVQQGRFTRAFRIEG
jgi:hypothetical protein